MQNWVDCPYLLQGFKRAKFCGWAVILQVCKYTMFDRWTIFLHMKNWVANSCLKGFKLANLGSSAIIY